MALVGGKIQIRTIYHLLMNFYLSFNLVSKNKYYLLNKVLTLTYVGYIMK